MEPLAGFAFTGVMNSGWLLSAAGPVRKLSTLASFCCSCTFDGVLTRGWRSLATPGPRLAKDGFSAV